MNIGIDISRSLDEKGGVRKYVCELVHALARIDQEYIYTLFPFFVGCFSWRHKQAPVPAHKNFSLYRPVVPVLNFLLWNIDCLPKDYLVGEIDLIHSPCFAAPLFRSKKLIVTIFDLTFLTHPHYHTKRNREFCSAQVRQAALRADKIIAVSHHTKQDIIKYLHVSPERIAVTHLGAGASYHPIADRTIIDGLRKKYTLPDRFVLYVGAIEPRKNLPRLIHAFLQVREASLKEYMLVLAGPRGWLNDDLHTRMNDPGLKGVVRYLGCVPDEDLPLLYNAASLFVYPSLYEGFGLPVVEAMACGTPVLVSNSSSLPEVVGDAGVVVDPLDTDAISQAIYTVLSNEALHRELSRKGLQRSQHFSWEKTARETLAVYKEVLHGG